MHLFQYWDKLDPPPDVVEAAESFKSENRDFDYLLLNEKTGEDFIAQHCSRRRLEAFRACAVPAMQSDYLRLCCMDVFGGLYVDVDNRCVRPLAGLIDQAPEAMLLTFRGNLTNGFLMFRRPGNVFLRACLDLMTQNVEERRFNVAYVATGPGIFIAVAAVIRPETKSASLANFDNPVCAHWGMPELVRCAERLIRPSAELSSALEDITTVDVGASEPWIEAISPAYKRTRRHWFRWNKDIYR